MQKLKRDHNALDLMVRLRQIVTNSNQTQTVLSEKIGRDLKTVQRFLAGETHMDALQMLYEICAACDTPTHVVFAPSIAIPTGEYTGIRSIDRMVNRIYSDHSPTGLEVLRKYVHDEYRVLCDAYGSSKSQHGQRLKEEYKRKYGRTLVEVDRIHFSTNELWDEGDNEKPEPNGKLQGLTYDDEYEINTIAARETHTHKAMKLIDASIIHDMVIVEYLVREYDITDRDRGVERKLMDTLVLNRPIWRYRENARTAPKIIRRHWRQLKDIESRETRFATDYEDYTSRKDPNWNIVSV